MPSPSDIKAGLAAAAQKAAGDTYRAQAGAAPPGGPQGVFDVSNDGTTWHPAVRLRASTGTTFVVDNGEVLITGESAGMTEYADFAALRASPPPTGGTVARVVTPPGEYRYSSASGAGFADNGATVGTIIKPTSVDVGSNGRWFSTAASATCPTFDALRGLKDGSQKHVHLQAHTTFGDGGGGIFDRVAVGSYVDDGGLCAVSGSWAWVRRERVHGPVNARWFGVQADATRTVPGTDNTSAMTAAHATGRVVYYPNGLYSFTKFSFEKGGIIGDGRGTQLWCRDTSEDNIITYTGNDETDTAEIDNPVGPIFRDFALLVPAVGSKSAGAGIRLDPGIDARPTDCPMVRNAQFHNLFIRYLPIGISLSNATAFTIDDCKLHYNAISGIYEDQPIPSHEDDGDNTISNNSIVGYTNTICVNYRGGGLRMWGNKVLLGAVGVQFSPLRSTSILKLFGNSIEAQSSSCVRFISGADTAASAFSQVQICDNILTSLSTGSPINVAPTHFTLQDLQINNNQIRTLRTDAANAVTIGKTERFTIVGNTFVGLSGAYRAIVTNADALYGKIDANLFTGFTYTALCVDASVKEETLVQTGNETTTTDTAYSTLFRGSETVTFPTPFRSAPKVMVCLNGFSNGEIAVVASSVTASNFVLTVIGQSNGASLSTNWRAEGLPV